MADLQKSIRKYYECLIELREKSIEIHKTLIECEQEEIEHFRKRIAEIGGVQC